MRERKQVKYTEEEDGIDDSASIASASPSDKENESDDFMSDESDSDDKSKKKKTAKSPAKKEKKTSDKKKSPAAKESKETKAKKSPAKKETSKAAAPLKGINSLGVSSNKASSSLNSAAKPVAEMKEDVHDITRGPTITNEASAKTLITEYLKQQNRPYSVIQLYDNLHQRISKNILQKAVDSLSASEASPLRCKEYGKAKIYFYNQNLLQVPSEEELAALDDEIEVLRAETQANQARLKEMQAEIERLKNEPEDDDLDRVLTEKEASMEAKKRKLSELQTNKVDINDLKDVVEKHNSSRKLWKERKQKAMEIIDMLSEEMSKSRREIIDMIGIETDEDANVSLPPLATWK